MDNQHIKKACENAWAKVARADSHLSEAKRIFSNYNSTDNIKFELTKPDNNGLSFWRVTAKETPPELACCIGDFFHNLNCSLDYLSTGLALSYGLRTKRLYFPIAKTQDLVTSSQSYSILKKTNFPLERVISHLQPWRGGKLSLWEIRQIDNRDKHNLIVPYYAQIEITGYLIKNLTRHNTYCLSFSIPINGVINAIAVNYEDRFSIIKNGHATGVLLFPDDIDAFAHMQVFSTMGSCYNKVQKAINIFYNAVRAI